ncbi:protein farnesyltransferase/geranylgeranyltransferase type-1 subunit alpha [Galendromus occidentalis]|uniref:Protein farnesyltransferase/geranylgeranyltransferase type-1 subunit alpha n=1 Tax=Galendromus occidentalis TaxID=34638 RepID=A0AAJ6QQ99_9ACAR|nr:protein farnesyltransferase/geranylgeranyltransferase type-1 subunit alpha [Galendromus occidentalis]XP_028966424.1 protein farnesyltransferase/geranylgeranyltransferase type-1 subunit alpha [Galendromus occidentalis]
MSSDEDHVLYKDRSDWADVKPLDIETDKDSVINIAYSETFRDCYGYLRAVLKSGELSERVFELTTTCADENPSCYTVWLLRRKLIAHLKKDLREELDFMVTQIQENQKNYQVWYHRQKMVEWLGDPAGELEFIRNMLEWDAKNYHAWQYRQWILRKFNLWDGELAVCDEMLAKDCRNNSAWNQRYFVVLNSTGFTSEVMDSEIEFTLDSVREVNYNESSWNYLRGIFKHANDKQKAHIINVLEKEFSSGRKSVFSLSILLDTYEATGQKDLALKAAEQLKEHDLLRANYWDFRARLLREE